MGDSTDTVTPQESKRIHQKLYFSLMRKLTEDKTVKDEAFAASRPKEWPDRFFFEKNSPDGRPTPAPPADDRELTFDEILHLIGSPGLREAMVKVGMGCEPCVSDSLTRMSAPAGQSMIFAGKQAHKALDFKCTGLNVAFGPQPRGQRIQEMGRNWRTCVNLPSVRVRQLFLWGENELLHNDLLLDSFYQAQNEAIDWLRLITISASLGCSTWWDFSQWGNLLESYHDMRPKETAWFFESQPRGSTPCLDARPSFAAASSSSSASASASASSSSDSGPSKQPFFRCNRTNLFTPMFLNDVKQDAGRIVSSRAGAFRPDEIVSDDNSGDPTCSRGTAVELHPLKGASRKYCLSDGEARALDAGRPRPPERRALRLQDLRPPPRRASPPPSPTPSPHTSHSRSLSAASRRAVKAARRPASASPAEAAASQAAEVAPPSPARGPRTSRSQSASAASRRAEKGSELPPPTTSPASRKADKPQPAAVAPPQAAAATGLADVGAPRTAAPAAASAAPAPAAPAPAAPVVTPPEAASGERAARQQRREEVRRLLSEVQNLTQRVARR